VSAVHQSSSSRYSYPGVDESYEQNKPSSNYDNYNWLFGNNDHNSDTEDTNAQTSSKCTMETYPSSIPHGKTDVTFLESASVDYTRVEDCVQECCQNVNCQYVWVFAKKCFLVGCSKEESDFCAPYAFGGTSGEIASTYYRVQLSEGWFEAVSLPLHKQIIGNHVIIIRKLHVEWCHFTPDYWN